MMYIDVAIYKASFVGNLSAWFSSFSKAFCWFGSVCLRKALLGEVLANCWLVVCVASSGRVRLREVGLPLLVV